MSSKKELSNKTKKIIILSLIVLFSLITIIMINFPTGKTDKDIIQETSTALEKKYNQKFELVKLKEKKKNQDVRLLEFKEKNKAPDNETFLAIYYNKNKILDYHEHSLWKKEIQMDYQESVVKTFGPTAYVIGLGSTKAQNTITQKTQSYKDVKRNDFTLLVTIPKEYKKSKKTKQKIYEFGKTIPKPFSKLEVYYYGEQNNSTKVSLNLEVLKDKKMSEKEKIKKIKEEKLEQNRLK